MIQNAKFNGDLVVAHALGQLLARNILEKEVTMPECIIPVPLHPLRLKLRGYNPALEIARPIAARLGVPVNMQICRRTRHTQPQTSLTIKQRRKNVRKAFCVTDNPGYRHVALIDDVITTGSTINELAKTLISAGVIKIDAWSCARAEYPRSN